MAASLWATPKSTFTEQLVRGDCLHYQNTLRVPLNGSSPVAFKCLFTDYRMCQKVPCSMHLLWCRAFTKSMEAMLCYDNVNVI